MVNAMMPLRNQHILITRTIAQGADLCQFLTEQGAVTYHIPTLEIHPHAANVNFPQADIAIFLSTNAVKYCPFNFFAQSVQYFAIGTATGNALTEHGVIAQQPKQENSEGLLDLPELQCVAGKVVAIFCGVGGRLLLQETLTKRGAHCQRYEVYQRYPAVSGREQLQLILKKNSLNYILCTSSEGLLSLEELAGMELLMPLHNIPLLVISRRLAVLALTRGFTQVIAMDEPFNNQGILQQFIQHIATINGDGARSDDS